MSCLSGPLITQKTAKMRDAWLEQATHYAKKPENAGRVARWSQTTRKNA